MKTSGYFYPTDGRIDTIKYANWGSRPYEYNWVIDVVSDINPSGMKVIDMGIGEPRLHGWPEFFKNNFIFDLYVGIDCNPELSIEQVDDSNYKLLCMDMTEMMYPDNYFNLGLCISTFEHFDSLNDLKIAFRETYRILRPESYLVVTMDEIWDGEKEMIPETFWSFLDASLRGVGYSFKDGIGFSIHDLIHEIYPYFYPVEEVIARKVNADENILHNDFYNNAISYCLLKSNK